MLPFRLGVIAAAIRIATATGIPSDRFFENVSLRLLCDGTNGSTSFPDSSPRPKTVTAVGNAQVSTSSPIFGTGSALFDGSGDRLEIPNSAEFDFGTGDFTIEAWVVRQATTGRTILTTYQNPSAGWSLYHGGAGFVSFNCTGDVADVTSSVALPVGGPPTHIAVTRAGTTLRIFFNGVIVGTATDSQNIASSAPLWIGGFPGFPSEDFNGRLDQIRITKGVARYTANFTPADFTEVVPLLMHFDGPNGSATFTDTSPAPKTVTPFGGAQISTTTPRFGTGAGLFDGAGDYLSIPSSSEFDLGDTYTVEFWVRFDDVARQAGLVHRGFYQTSGTIWTGLAFSIRQLNNRLRCYFFATVAANEQFIDTPANLVTGQWYHVAMVRNGTTGAVYIDGALAGSISGLNLPAASTRPLIIGDWPFDAGGTLTNQFFAGRIDELRITRGSARYTAPFTAPSAPFADP